MRNDADLTLRTLVHHARNNRKWFDVLASDYESRWQRVTHALVGRILAWPRHRRNWLLYYDNGEWKVRRNGRYWRHGFRRPVFSHPYIAASDPETALEWASWVTHYAGKAGIQGKGAEDHPYPWKSRMRVSWVADGKDGSASPPS